MHTIIPSLRRSAGLLFMGAALVLPAARILAADATYADAFPDYESYIKISGQAPFITGDPAAFANRTGAPSNGSGGIEDLYFTKDLPGDTTMTLKGRALGGIDDYLANINFENDKVGSIDAGYSRFRTFYDGVGGFFPLANQFEALASQDLHVDRATTWIEAKLTKPGTPVFTVSFRNNTRTGMKDSSEWAPIINPNAVITKGKLVGNALPANTPYIGPNVMTIDEHRNTFEAGMVANIGKTEETLKATYESINNNDGRGYVKYPASTVIADPTVTVQDDQEVNKYDSFRVVNETETKFTDQIAFNTGLSYVHMSSTDGGNWITPSYNATANVVYPTQTATGIYGTSKFDDYIGNVSVDWTPTKAWRVSLAYRDESNTVTSEGGFNSVSLASNATSVLPKFVTTAQDLDYSHYTEHVSTPEFTVEYSGFSSLSLYAEIQDRVDNGQQHWVNPYAAVSTTGTGVVTTSGAPIGNVFYQEADQNNEEAKVGFNWTPVSMFTVRTEVYQKDHENRFVGANDLVGTASYGGLYATGYDFLGVKLSVIFKPLPQLTFNTRYQPQSGTIFVTANPVNGGVGNEITSGKARTQMISETVNWTPNERVYVQGNLNVVYSYIQTAYPVVVVSTTTYIPTPIQNANNNYVAGSALAGFVVDKQTDADVKISWLRSDDYNAGIAPGGQPFGAGFNEHSYTAGLKHQFTPALRGELRGGYMKRVDQTTGYFTNYDGPIAYVSLTYAL